MGLKDMWQLGTGWKVTVAATTVAALGGAALASPGLGGGDLPPIDLDSPAIIELDETPSARFQVDNTVIQFDLDSTFASADLTDQTDDSATSTTLAGADDTDASPLDDTDDSVIDDTDDSVPDDTDASDLDDTDDSLDDTDDSV